MVTPDRDRTLGDASCAVREGEFQVVAPIPADDVVRKAKPNVPRVIACHGADNAGLFTKGLILSAPLALAGMISAANRRSDPYLLVAIDRERNHGPDSFFGIAHGCKTLAGVPPKFGVPSASRPDRSIAVTSKTDDSTSFREAGHGAISGYTGQRNAPVSDPY